MPPSAEKNFSYLNRAKVFKLELALKIDEDAEYDDYDSILFGEEKITAMEPEERISGWKF